MRPAARWVPAVILALGAAAVSTTDAERAMRLSQPLAASIPREFQGIAGQDYEIPEQEREIAGMTDYVMRLFPVGDERSGEAFSIYVGYHARRGQTIHSPKNCLPGSGWESLVTDQTQVATAEGPVTVNRALVHRKGDLAVVYYWYQGRGRVEASEYAVKLQLVRDAIVRRRTDEALVRIIVPVTNSESAAADFATSVARNLIPAVDAALPS